MGALTSKLKSYSYRSWEYNTFIEIDETEVKLNHIRIDKLKSKRFRILPINYWIADKKRFASEKAQRKNPSVSFLFLRWFKLESNLQEAKQVQYLISNIKGYKKILDKVYDTAITNINIFSGKRLTNNVQNLNGNKFQIFDDLLTNRTKTINQVTPTKFDLNNDVIFICNPRLESPELNAFLFQHSDEYSFTSFSTFASNIKKEEIPLTNYNLIASFQGYYNLQGKTIIHSCYQHLPSSFHTNSLILTPLANNRVILPYPINKEISKSINFILSSKTIKYFHRPFIGEPSLSSISLSTSFDHFILKRVNHKFLDRLYLLAYLLRPSLLSPLAQVNYLQIKSSVSYFYKLKHRKLLITSIER
jgi:hypothetical protein